MRVINNCVWYRLGVGEMEIRAKQLVKLCESYESHMILETKKKINRDLNLTLSERAREESALPTDLWKKPVGCSAQEAFFSFRLTD